MEDASINVSLKYMYHAITYNYLKLCHNNPQSLKQIYN